MFHRASLTVRWGQSHTPNTGMFYRASLTVRWGIKSHPRLLVCFTGRFFNSNNYDNGYTVGL